MIVFTCFFVCLLGVAQGAQYAWAASAKPDAIDRWISQHAARMQGAEVTNLRHRVTGDLDSAGGDDAAVLYTMRVPKRGESRYLAVFVSSRQGLKYHGHTLVAGPRAGEAVRATILKRAVVVEMLTYAPGDAACCPTRQGSRRYQLTAKGVGMVGR